MHKEALMEKERTSEELRGDAATAHETGDAANEQAGALEKAADATEKVETADAKKK